VKPTLLIHHSANRGRLHPPTSLPGLVHCLEHGARVVEVDISPTADGDFALLHGPMLERETNGAGPILEKTTAQLSDLRYVWQGAVTDVPIGFLDQALDLIRDHPQPFELQLDLKPYGPLMGRTLDRFLDRLQPVKDKVRVTCPADWMVRALHAADPDLPFGFDPLLYLSLQSPHGNERDEPPFRMGAYGYLDDHPLGTYRWGSPADYLAARAEALWVQCPPGAIWYINAWLLARALDEGFDWIADLHSRGAEVDAWTLDPDRPDKIALAQRMIEHRIDRITTNDAPTLAQALGGEIVY